MTTGSVHLFICHSLGVVHFADVDRLPERCGDAVKGVWGGCEARATVLLTWAYADATVNLLKVYWFTQQ
jgi:hypothetical protein